MRGVRITPEVTGYIVDLARATRQSPSLRLGVSPRGATALQAASRAWAWLAGRDYVIPDDVKALARPTLRHRVQLRPEAELEGATADGVLEAVLASSGAAVTPGTRRPMALTGRAALAALTGALVILAFRTWPRCWR